MTLLKKIIKKVQKRQECNICRVTFIYGYSFVTIAATSATFQPFYGVDLNAETEKMQTGAA